MSGGRPFSPKRFRSLAILVLNECKQGGMDPRDLWSVMFQTDMEAWRQTGKSLTGATYIKTADGVRPRKRGEKAASR